MTTVSKPRPVATITAVFLLCASVPGAFGVAYFSSQYTNWPALPANVLNLPTVQIGTCAWLLDDLDVDYKRLAEEWQQQAAQNGPNSGPAANGPLDNGWNGSCICASNLWLLAPVLQGPNALLNFYSSDPNGVYDLYTVSNLLVTNWTFVARSVPGCTNFVVTNVPPLASFYVIACTNDTDGDGLTDAYEALSSKTDPQNVDTDYDGRSDYEELQEGTDPLDAASFTPVQLGYWSFNDTGWLGKWGQAPTAAQSLHLADGWITKAVQISDTGALLKYRDYEPGGKANINLRSGSARFWFKPVWSSGAGPGASARLLEAGSPGGTGWWTLLFDATGNHISFVSQTNGLSPVTNLVAAVSLVSNRWCQIVLTYTNNAVALYTNGVLAATNTGALYYPDASVRANGFTIGCDASANAQAKGVLEDLETFNYPLSPDDILANYELTLPPTLIPGLRMWLKADAGYLTNALSRVDPWLDQSGNANSAGQPLENYRPIYKANGLQGKPAMYFGGTNYFNLPNNLSNGLAEAEVFVVLQAVADGQTHGLWSIGSGASLYPYNDGSIADGFAAQDYLRMGPPAQALNQPHIYNVFSRSNEWACRINGVIHYSMRSSTVRFAPPFYLGNGGNFNFCGYIAEVLMYSRKLNQAERLAVGSYLGQRYALLSAPAAPANVAATVVSADQVSLSWSGILSTTGMTYTVQRRTPSIGYQRVAVLENALSYLDTGLAPGTVYYYRVAAANYAGQSAYSAETSTTTPSGGTSVPLDGLKLWLKADCGHGGSPINYWSDQTTNDNGACYRYPDLPKQPVCAAAEMNGSPAIYFQGTNGFWLPPFTTDWTTGEAFVVLKSLGSTSNQVAGLCLICATALHSGYPETNGHIRDTFGRISGDVDTGPPSISLTNAHLYNVMASPTDWFSKLNNQPYSSATNGPGGFNAAAPRLGWGASADYFRGYISEVLIYNRQLTDAERNAVADSYLRGRFNLY